MTNSTSNTYQMKRQILSFLKKISRNLSKPDKFCGNSRKTAVNWEKEEMKKK